MAGRRCLAATGCLLLLVDALAVLLTAVAAAESSSSAADQQQQLLRQSEVLSGKGTKLGDQLGKELFKKTLLKGPKHPLGPIIIYAYPPTNSTDPASGGISPANSGGGSGVDPSGGGASGGGSSEITPGGGAIEPRFLPLDNGGSGTTIVDPVIGPGSSSMPGGASSYFNTNLISTNTAVSQATLIPGNNPTVVIPGAYICMVCYRYVCNITNICETCYEYWCTTPNAPIVYA